MRMSTLFGQTLREPPAEAEVSSHQLLVRAGYIRQLGTGIFSYLPLARRAIDKIEAILRRAMEGIGAQELTMPVVHPAEVWKRTRRWYEIGAEMGRLKDREGRELALAMTHEEVVADLLRSNVRSYRDLPRLIYHIQTKWRDDPRPRAGLIRVREFTMKDSYSLDTDWEGLDRQYRAHYQAYFDVFARCALPVIAVSSDVGMMGGQLAHEYMYLTPIGEDTLLICDSPSCGYTANRQIARFRKPPAAPEEPLPLAKVATPGMRTIDELARYLGVPSSRTAKAVFLVATIGSAEGETSRFIFAVVRGDMEVNETKLANAVKASELRPATEEEIRATGSVPGYASPIGLHDVLVVADEAAASSPNLVAGANEEGYHFLNTNCGRDYSPTFVADIAAAAEGSACPSCGSPMRSSRGVEVGNIFKLGTRYTEAVGATFLDRDGVEKPVIMGSYGIGVGRLLACIAEEHHDERGLCWPASVSPFALHLVMVPGGRAPETADRLYEELEAAGVEALYDDREERAGVKFMDADLIGIPLRLTVGERGIAKGVVELKHRRSAETAAVPVAETISRVKTELRVLREALEARVAPVTYRG